MLVWICVGVYLVVGGLFWPKFSHTLYINHQGSKFAEYNWPRGFSLFVGALRSLVWPIALLVSKATSMSVAWENEAKEKERLEEESKWATYRYEARSSIELRLKLLAFDRETNDAYSSARLHNMLVRELAEEISPRVFEKRSSEKPFTRSEAFDIVAPYAILEIEGENLKSLEEL